MSVECKQGLHEKFLALMTHWVVELNGYSVTRYKEQYDLYIMDTGPLQVIIGWLTGWLTAGSNGQQMRSACDKLVSNMILCSSEHHANDHLWLLHRCNLGHNDKQTQYSAYSVNQRKFK